MWYWQAIWGRYFIGSPHSWASVSWRDQMVNVLSLQPMNWKIPKIPQIPRAILSWKVVNPRTEECGGGGVNPLDPQSCRGKSARGGSRWRWGGLRRDGQPGQPGQSCVHLLPADHRLRGCAHLSRSHPNVLSHVNNLSLFVSSCPVEKEMLVDVRRFATNWERVRGWEMTQTITQIRNTDFPATLPHRQRPPKSTQGLPGASETGPKTLQVKGLQLGPPRLIYETSKGQLGRKLEEGWPPNCGD